MAGNFFTENSAKNYHKAKQRFHKPHPDRIAVLRTPAAPSIIPGRGLFLGICLVVFWLPVRA